MISSYIHTLDSPIYTSLPMCPLWGVRDVDSENGGHKYFSQPSAEQKLAAQLAQQHPANIRPLVTDRHKAFAFTRKIHSNHPTAWLQPWEQLLYYIILFLHGQDKKMWLLVYSLTSLLSLQRWYLTLENASSIINCICPLLQTYSQNLGNFL